MKWENMVKNKSILETWFGKHLIVRKLPYTGKFDFIAGIVEFENGSKMSIEKDINY